MPTVNRRGWSVGRRERSLRATLEREAPKGPNPLSLDDANLIAGIKLYDTNCAVCHGASAGRPSNIALGLYQKPPQLAKDGVEDDPDGVIYWKVAHGIRLTGDAGVRQKARRTSAGAPVRLG